MGIKLVEAARRDTYQEVQDSRYICHQLLVFDEKFLSAVESELRRGHVEDRLQMTSAISVMTLFGLTVLYGSFSFLNRWNERKRNK